MPVRAETFVMVGGIVAVNPVAREHARTCICRRQLVSWVVLLHVCHTLCACMPCREFDAAVAVHELL